MEHTDFIFEPEVSFQEKALKIFQYQRSINEVFGKFCDVLGIREVNRIDEIPLLPIQAFKDAEIITTPANSNLKLQTSKLIFQSSGTSGMQRSRHYVSDPEVYRNSLVKGMQQFYELDNFVIWAYTPGYNENPNSSLIWMLNSLIERDSSGLSRFLELGAPLNPVQVKEVETSGKRLMLFGAAFGLLDLLELRSIRFPEDSVIMETGGMKTHRREMSREELHQILSEGFNFPPEQIHSEYGMTELLSQAYSLGDEWFHPVPWMKVSIRNPKNPMEKQYAGQEGLIGIIDLANVHSCSFILTGDKGLQKEDGTFQVLGRWNPEDLRGCNFLIDRD